MYDDQEEAPSMEETTQAEIRSMQREAMSSFRQEQQINQERYYD